MSVAPKFRRDAGEFFRTFLSLGREDRRSVALQILRDQRVLADLYDHFLIQEAMAEPGRNTSWDTYVRKNRPAAP